jgi:hypothetical protein
MNYDPNLVLCGRTAKQRVRLTFGSWDCRKTVEAAVSGNCRGLDVIECAVETVYDRLGDDGMLKANGAPNKANHGRRSDA